MKEPASDCAYPGERVDYDVEQAYRRGIEQGAHFACCIVELGGDCIDVRKWITKRLHPWRLSIIRRRRKSDNTVTAGPVPGPERGQWW